MKINSFFTVLFLIICFDTNAQMKMRVDPKTSKVTYDVIGNVISFNGDVFQKDDSRSRSKRVGLNFGVKKGDLITTGDQSYVKIKLVDGTLISLGPDSFFSFKEFSFRTITDRNAMFELLKGKMRVKVINKIEKGKLKFNTLSLSLGVRGTEFLANQDFDKDGTSKEQIALLKGNISVDSKKSSFQKDLKENSILQTEFNQKTGIKTKVSDLTPEQIKFLNSPIEDDGSFSNFLNTKVNFSEGQKGIESFSIDKKSQPEINLKIKNWRESLKELNRKYEN